MIRYLTSFLVGVTLLAAPACGGKRIPVVVGQTGLAVVQSIGQLQSTAKQLTDAGVLPAPVALTIQTKLLALNDKARPLPDILRQIDALEQAGSSSAVPVEQAIAILTLLSSDVSLVVQGVPIADSAKALLDAVTATQKTVTTTLIEVAKLKGGA